MKKFILLTILFITNIYSQETTNSFPVNEYRYQNGALVCFSDSISGNTDVACLHIGNLRIGDSFSSVNQKYGKPDQIINQSNGKEVKVYQIKSKSNEITYLAITVKENIISAIQLAGAKPDDVLSFSSINLEDSPRVIIEMLGKPSSSRLVEETGATLWSYAPFPFSFEILNKKVNSIKIWQP